MAVALHCANEELTEEGAGAGQAVVQFATNIRSRQEAAIKLFLSKSAFNEEVRQYADAASALHQFLPRCLGIFDNVDGRCVSLAAVGAVACELRCGRSSRFLPCKIFSLGVPFSADV